jgi:hypothetical protein
VFFLTLVDSVQPLASRAITKTEKQKEHRNALDDFRFAIDALVSGNGFVVHVGWVYPFTPDPGHRSSPHPNYSR